MLCIVLKFVRVKTRDLLDHGPIVRYQNNTNRLSFARDSERKYTAHGSCSVKFALALSGSCLAESRLIRYPLLIGVLARDCRSRLVSIFGQVLENCQITKSHTAL